MRALTAIAAALLVALPPAVARAQEGAPAVAPDAEKPPAQEAPPQAGEAAAAGPAGIPWAPAGQGVFDLARQLRRPVLLYISALWEYHDDVMSRITYGDPRVQALVRERYVPVRVDTDDRPDLFNRYGMGAWPTTSVLLDDGHPFYFPEETLRTVKRAGGTFFAPDDFLAYFGQLADYWEANQETVRTVTEETDSRILQKRSAERADLSAESLEVVVGALLDRFGTRAEAPVEGTYHPEFGMARLAFYYWSLKSDRRVLDMALGHLVDLARGGIHDRVGGGFFRIAHDALYRVPSFEKLPGVNAAAIQAYLEAWEATGHANYLDIARDTLEHVRSRGWNPHSHSFSGAMAASVAGGGNGDYYTWTEDELKGLLSGEEYEVAAAAFDIRTIGDLKDYSPRRNVIFLDEGPVLYAERTGMPREKAAALLESALGRMKAARDARSAPQVDGRTFGDWSGQMISAFLHAARATGDEKAAATALEALAVLLERCRTGPILVAHVCRPDAQETSGQGFLSDQGRVIGALLDAYEYTGEERHLAVAQGIASLVVRDFRDITTGGFSDAPGDPSAPGLMAWPFRDMTENMVMAEALLRLGLLAGREELVREGRKSVESWADEYAEIAQHASLFALASQKFLVPPLEILVVGGQGVGEESRALMAKVRRLYHPWRIVRHFDQAEGLAELRRRGLRTLEGPQVVLCSASECSGAIPPSANLRAEVEKFTSPGRARTATP